MGFEPAASGLHGQDFRKSKSAPTFNRWSFDPSDFRADQETDREEIPGDDGDIVADSHANPKTTLRGTLRMKKGATEYAKPPNVGDWVQIKGGDTDAWQDSTNTYWWLTVTEVGQEQLHNGKVVKAPVVFEYRPSMQDQIENGSNTGISDADTALS